MSQGTRRWPTVGTRHETLRAHGNNLIAEIQQLLEFAQADRIGDPRGGKDMPARIYEPFLSSVGAFVRHATQPAQNEAAQIREMYSMMQDMHANIAVIRTQGKPSLFPANAKTANNTLSWAQIASRDAPPPSVQNPTPSGATTTTIDIAKHKEVVMRHEGNKPVPKSLHTLSPADLIKTLNNALQNASEPEVNTVRFTAARVNARGSIVAHTGTANEAETLRRNRDAWKEQVAKGLEVMMPTYPVLIHGIPINSWNMDKKKEMFERLSFENTQALGGHKLAGARWLKKYKDNQRDGSIIIDCETPEGANAIIKAGTLAWHHGLRMTKKCDPACQFLRCLKCYRYGKCKGTYCTNNETCGKCSSQDHNTNECTSNEKKCCLCGGQHYAWAQQCPEYKKEIQRVQIAKDRLELNPWYPEVARKVNPGPSNANNASPSRNGSVATQGSTDTLVSVTTQRDAAAQNSVATQGDAAAQNVVATQSSVITWDSEGPEDEVMEDAEPEAPEAATTTRKRKRQPLKETNANVTHPRSRESRSQSPSSRGQKGHRTRSQNRGMRAVDVSDSENENRARAKNPKGSQKTTRGNSKAAPRSGSTNNPLTL